MTFSFRIQMYRRWQIDFLLLMSIKLCQKMLKNSEKFSAKILTPLKFKRNLLSLKCFLESVLSQCEMNGIFLSAHINNKRLLTSVALLLRLSKGGTMPNAITELPLFFNGVVKGCVRYIFASLFCKSKGEHL